jgi:hypothetical protein
LVALLFDGATRVTSSKMGGSMDKKKRGRNPNSAPANLLFSVEADFLQSDGQSAAKLFFVCATLGLTYRSISSLVMIERST